MSLLYEMTVYMFIALIVCTNIFLALYISRGYLRHKKKRRKEILYARAEAMGRWRAA